MASAGGGEGGEGEGEGVREGGMQAGRKGIPERRKRRRKRGIEGWEDEVKPVKGRDEGRGGGT
jgi:hypothetical protein